MDFTTYKHHPMLEKIVDILSARTQNPDKNFFTILVAYHLTKCASVMRTKVNAQGFGKHYVNFYGINCAPSGYGKGHSSSIVEDELIHLFKQQFLETTLPIKEQEALESLGIRRAARSGNPEEDEIQAAISEYKKLGAYVYSFDSGTGPAVKQFRHKILMAKIGAINFEVDEIGNNLLNSKEIVDLYLELFDGVVKPKLIKNTTDSTRNEEIDGKSPTNMLMFGTASALLDGAATEKAYTDMLLTGYARRCFFGYSAIERPTKKLSKAERKQLITNKANSRELQLIAAKLERKADPINYGMEVDVPDDVIEAIIDYQMYCEDIMDSFRQSDEIRRAEARGRFYKALKLAGTFSFLDGTSDMTLEQWQAAVKVAEMSASCFYDMLDRPPTHARLAIYLTECKSPATTADLVEDLPYFPKTGTQQKDLIKHAIAWGYKNNVIIKRSFVDEIELLSADALAATDLDGGITGSHSSDMTQGFKPFIVPWAALSKLVVKPNHHWCAHSFVDGHRRKSNTIQGFNLLVLDCDGDARLEQAREILKDYTYLIYTTKRHTDDVHRFRVVLPMSHTLKLSPDDYSLFMENVFSFLPFTIDEQVKDTSRKWLCNDKAQVFENDGKLFDVLPFIPKTKKADEYAEFISKKNMPTLERYFHRMIQEGNRNNTLFRYAAVLLDGGYGLQDTIDKIKTFNSQLDKPIPATELNDTVIKSITARAVKKGIQ